MKSRIAQIFIAALGLLIMSCTSSNSVSGTQTNSGYDSTYREQTRSSNTNYQSGGQLNEEAQGDPPITIMLMSMETGDVYPGEDYYVYAVVDNPDNRDLEYVWSVANGSVSEVPESERGRLTSIVEEEYNTGGFAAPAPAGEVGVVGGSQLPAEGAPPGAAPPSGLQRPGAVAGESSFGDGPVSGRVATPGSGSPDPGRTSNPDEAAKIQEEGEANSGRTLIQGADSKSSRGAEGDEPDEGEPEPEKPEEPEDPGKDGETAFVLERSIVAGPYSAQDIGDDPQQESDEEEVSGEAEEAGNTPEEVAEAIGRSDSSEPAEVAERISQGTISAAGSDDAVLIGDDYRMSALSDEYEHWKEGEGIYRRQPLGPYGDDDESESLESDESYEDYRFVTDEPYILWTPNMPGDTTIYLKVSYKEEDLTEPTGLDVNIRLKEPTLEIADEFPEIVREDETVFLKLDGENIPSFNKGLITLTYDFNMLSFREAELGAFFDDAPDASLYYAQPDKNSGKVLLAIDSNTEIINLSGSDVVAYVKFKAKQDIADLSETGLTLQSDSGSRYILDRNGENVLPEPMEYPVFRTEVTAAPALPSYNRENTPGAAPAGATGRTNPAAAGGGGVPVSPTGRNNTARQNPSQGLSAQPQQPAGAEVITEQPQPGGSELLSAGERSAGSAGDGAAEPVINEEKPELPGTAPEADARINIELTEAVMNDDMELVRQLVSNGANPNWIDAVTGRTPLQLAVAEGNMSLVEALVRLGGDPNLPGSEGKSAIDYATEYEETAILEFLQQAAK